MEAWTRGFTALLGEGGFGSIYRGELPAGPEIVVKEISQADSFEAELRVLASVRHPHLVTIIASAQLGDLRYLVLEHLNGGDLNTRVANDVLFKCSHRLRAITDVARGLTYLHSLGVFHRDLKPNNVCLTHCGLAKLIDFGLAVRFNTEEGKVVVPSAAGTTGFRCPVYESSRVFTLLSESYSLGITLLFVMTGAAPTFVRQGMLRYTWENIHAQPFSVVQRKVAADWPPLTTRQAGRLALALTAMVPGCRPLPSFAATRLQCILDVMRG